MKITMRDVLESYGVLNALMNNHSFDLRTGYNLGKTLKSLKREAESYDEQIAVLESRFKNEKGNIDPKRLPEYLEAVREFKSETVEVWATPITITMLRNAMILAHKQAKPEDKDFEPTLPPAILSPLDWLIVDDEVKAQPEQAEAVTA
jgi:hypothetical protein